MPAVGYLCGAITCVPEFFSTTRPHEQDSDCLLILSICNHQHIMNALIFAHMIQQHHIGDCIWLPFCCALQWPLRSCIVRAHISLCPAGARHIVCSDLNDVQNFAISPDGAFLALWTRQVSVANEMYDDYGMNCWGNHVRIYNVSTGYRLGHAWFEGSPCQFVAWSPDMRSIIIVSSESGDIVDLGMYPFQACTTCLVQHKALLMGSQKHIFHLV